MENEQNKDNNEKKCKIKQDEGNSSKRRQNGEMVKMNCIIYIQRSVRRKNGRNASNRERNHSTRYPTRFSTKCMPKERVAVGEIGERVGVVPDHANDNEREHQFITPLQSPTSLAELHKKLLMAPKRSRFLKRDSRKSNASA